MWTIALKCWFRIFLINYILFHLLEKLSGHKTQVHLFGASPQQIDIYHNDKLQYLYLTSDRISLVDRLGRYVPKFPFYKPDSVYFRTLATHSFGESDHQYFIVSNQKGDLYMYNNLRETSAWLETYSVEA